LSQFESQFEERLYNERREKLAKIAEIGARSSLSTAEATYPNHFRFSPENIDVPTIRQQYEPLSGEQLEADKPHIAIAGRLVAIRLQGKAGFAQLQQGGQRLQIYVRKDNVGEDGFELYKLLDLGDHVGVEGYLFRTRTNELTVHVEKLTFLTKAMLPLPDKFSGLGDIELRYRRRYLDLFTDNGDFAEPHENSVVPSEGAERSLSPLPNSVILSEGAGPHPAPQSKDLHDSQPQQAPSPLSATEPPQQTRLPAREVFVKRAAILRAIRAFFDARGYLEVETPMLHTVAGGATARTFTTHHNAEDMELTLRIAPELHLKRLVVGGFDRVYEINRNFRNEGVDTTHNPEFTMLEFYQAYAHYHDLMDLTQELITTVAQEVNGTTITHFDGNEIDLSKWTKLSMREAIQEFWPIELGADAWQHLAFDSYETLLPSVRELHEMFRGLIASMPHLAATVPAENLAAHDEISFALRSYRKNEATVGGLRQHLEKQTAPLGKVIAELFEFLAEPHLIQPTIIYDFPLAVSPLSKIKPDEPDWVERFEFYIGGFEVGNAFSELNDPGDQRQRFLAQLAAKEAGDEEASDMDEDYVRALGYGLPPTAGEGIGIDRLTMLLTGSRSIRDVILFPLMRPQKSTATPEEDHGESAE
jgi:lysyl-tRNA synthetase, class II